MQSQLDKVIREKKETFYEFKNSGNKNSDPVATNSNTKIGETQGKYPEGTAVIIGDSVLNEFIQERLSRKGRAVTVHNFQGATVDNMNREEPSFIIHAGSNDAPYSTSQKILDNLLTLKSCITDNLPKCKVVIPTPTLRTTDWKVAST